MILQLIVHIAKVRMLMINPAIKVLRKQRPSATQPLIQLRITPMRILLINGMIRRARPEILLIVSQVLLLLRRIRPRRRHNRIHDMARVEQIRSRIRLRQRLEEIQTRIDGFPLELLRLRFELYRLRERGRHVAVPVPAAAHLVGVVSELGVAHGENGALVLRQRSVWVQIDQAGVVAQAPAVLVRLAGDLDDAVLVEVPGFLGGVAAADVVPFALVPRALETVESLEAVLGRVVAAGLAGDLAVDVDGGAEHGETVAACFAAPNEAVTVSVGFGHQAVSQIVGQLRLDGGGLDLVSIAPCGVRCELVLKICSHGDGRVVICIRVGARHAHGDAVDHVTDERFARLLFPLRVARVVVLAALLVLHLVREVVARRVGREDRSIQTSALVYLPFLCAALGVTTAL